MQRKLRDLNIATHNLQNYARLASLRAVTRCINASEPGTNKNVVFVFLNMLILMH